MSLRRLRLEQIPLFQLHRIDPQVPLEEQVGTSSVTHVEDNIAAAGLSLPDSEFAALEAAVR